MEKINYPVPTVNDIKVFETRGPWDTKSGGRLDVLFAIPFVTAQKRYFHYKKTEIDRVPSDIRGLRVYTVRDLPNGRIGGTEWHRIREEMVFALEGSVSWTCEDLFGGKRNFILDASTGIWMPPFIRHTYEVREEKSGLFIIANTLFNPEDSRTYDTYSQEAFRKLQTEYGATAEEI